MIHILYFEKNCFAKANGKARMEARGPAWGCKDRELLREITSLQASKLAFERCFLFLGGFTSERGFEEF